MNADVAHVKSGQVVTATTTVQAVMAFAAFILSAIAPAVAEDLDVSASLIGYQMALVFGSGILTSLNAGTFIRRFGACRTSQISLSLGGIGCLITLYPHYIAIAIASVFIGLAYGLTNPSASHLLSRLGNPQYRNLIFSIKQTGVPIGGAFAGLVAPSMALAWGWKSVPVLGVIVIVALIAVLQIKRGLWDDDREKGASLTTNPLRDLRATFQSKPLLWLALTSVFFSMVQLCLTAYLVTMLVEEISYSLVAAGFVLSVSQGAAIGGRLFWGWLADRLQNGLLVLTVISVIVALCAFATVGLHDDWSTSIVWVLFAVFGMTAIGWNGVYFAEIARLSPEGKVSSATGGALVFTYSGVLAGPLLFMAVYEMVGSYTATFGYLGGIAFLGGIAALIAGRVK